MKNPLIVSALFLLPAFFLLQGGFSFERASLLGIHRFGDRTSARQKLAELGYSNETAYENFRYKEIIFASGFTFISILLGMIKEFSLLTVLGLTLLSISVSIFALEWQLTQKIKAHRTKIESEFPAVIEMLTLSLSAGESPLSAMQRVSVRGSGVLSTEFAKVVDEVSKGKVFAQALDEFGKRLRSTNIRRFIDSLVIAISRGAPLVDVLQSHAKEAQIVQRNRILSLASKSEISMMIPVVFLILPISILFALWPSLSNLNTYSGS